MRPPSDFSKRLDNAKIGDEYSIRMAMGRFTFEGEFEKAAFLSGGIGITPIRSILKYATDMRLSSNLILLYSSQTPEYLIFFDDLEAMKKANKNLKTVYTLTDYDKDMPNCRKGRIGEEMIREEVPDYADRKFFTCGPPAMVEAMRSLLTDRLSVSKGDIITEDFLGY